MSLSRIATLAAVSGVLVAMVGCTHAPIPVAENFEITSQKKVRSAGHWELLASDVISQTSLTLEKAGIAAGTDLYVAEQEHASPFDKAFRQFLITELVEGGKSVRQSPEGAVRVDYSTLVIRHDSERPHFIPGVYTMITGGLYAVYGLRNEHLDLKLAAGLVAAGLADYANSTYTGGPTHTELILTTTVTSGDRYISSKTDVYYVEEDDVGLFAKVLPKPVPYAKVMGVVGQ